MKSQLTMELRSHNLCKGDVYLKALKGEVIVGLRLGHTCRFYIRLNGTS